MYWRPTDDPFEQERRVRLLLPVAVIVAVLAFAVMIGDILGYL